MQYLFVNTKGDLHIEGSPFIITLGGTVTFLYLTTNTFIIHKSLLSYVQLLNVVHMALLEMQHPQLLT